MWPTAGPRPCAHRASQPRAPAESGPAIRAARPDRGCPAAPAAGPSRARAASSAIRQSSADHRRRRVVGSGLEPAGRVAGVVDARHVAPVRAAAAATRSNTRRTYGSANASKSSGASSPAHVSNSIAASRRPRPARRDSAPTVLGADVEQPCASAGSPKSSRLMAPNDFVPPPSTRYVAIGERRAGEPDQRHAAGELAPKQAHRVEHVAASTRADPARAAAATSASRSDRAARAAGRD